MSGTDQTHGTLLTMLSPTAREEFIGSCQKMHLEENSQLFVRGQPCTYTYLICSGLVRVYYGSPAGKEVTLAYFGPGVLIGDPGFLSQAPYVWSAQSESDSILLRISADRLQTLIHKNVELAEYVIKTLSFKVQWLSSLLQIMSTESVDQRLLHLLFKLSELHGYEHEGTIVLTLHLTHKQLATMVGASRPWVSSALHRLQREGRIAIEQDCIRLKDADTLRKAYT